MACILALDQGTTSSRAIVFDEQQQILGIAQQSFEQLFPRPGWVEHDPNDIWQSQRDVAVQAIVDAGLTSRDIAAIGITNQRETTVVWDRRTGQPLCNAIVWQDRRTADFCSTLRDAGHEDHIHNTTGLVLDPYFSASKIRWILDNCEDSRTLAAAGNLAFGTVDTWLIWNLTNGRVHATDSTNASRTALFNLHTLDWDASLLELWDIPQSMLPTVCTSSGEVARCAIPELAGIPICGIAGDQQAALFGQTCFAIGEAKCTYGTGCFMLLNTGRSPVISKNKLLTTVAWTIDDETEYALEGSVFMGGALVQWLRDGLGIIEHAEDIESLAASVDDSDGGVFVPAFSGLGAPFWDPHARGTIIGLTRGTHKAHIARAALEGIAFQVADVFGAMKADAGDPIAHVKVDGGASANKLLMQLQCDIVQSELIRSTQQESTALGAASLAGLAVGIWSDRAELKTLWRESERFLPSSPSEKLDSANRRWLDAVERARNWDSPHEIT